jgi:hypothetical protein
MRYSLTGLILGSLLLGLLLVACTKTKIVEVVVTPTPKAAAAALPPTDTPAPAATATPEPPTATPEPAGPSECAAGITAELRDIQARIDWDVYCATYLPPGYVKEVIGGPNPLDIHLLDSSTGNRIIFVQGEGIGLSALTSLIRYEGELVGPVDYGVLSAQLYRSLPGAEHGPFVAVMADTGGGPIQYIEAYGVSEEDITAVAASMLRLETLP